MRYNEGDIKKHLQKITSRWDELQEKALFEIRGIKEGNIPLWKKFNTSQIDEAIRYATDTNSQKYNVYVTVNPISSRTNGRAGRDEDVIASFYCFCDCDTTDSVENYNKMLKDCKGNFGVYTGMKPKRGHIYYELDKPITDMELWSSMQRAIANHLQSDPVVNNPSRIMRLAGTVNYPTPKKIEKGRIEELAEYRTMRSDIKTVEGLQKAFRYNSNQQFHINLDDLSQREKLDIEQTIAKIKAGNDWHDNMIRVVASLVAKGRADHEIHAVLSDITLSGYTSADTIKEIDVAIRGAREKGFTGVDKSAKIQEAFNDTSDSKDMFRRWELTDPLTIPRREFLYGNHYIKDYLSMTVAPGGVGKSTLVLTEVLAMVTGKPLLGVEPSKKCNALYFNAEDPLDEVKRRVIAVCQYYEIKQEDISGLMIGSGRETEMLLMAGEDGLMNEKLVNNIAQTIADNDIDVLVIDPLASVINSPESVDNFRLLAKTLSALADTSNVAIEIVHHTRKLNHNQDATIEDSRGGSSLVAAIRSGRILRNMDKSKGTELGINNYIDFFSINMSGKSNLSRPPDKTQWYQKIGIRLPNEDWVAIVQKYEVPNAFDDITTHQCVTLWQSIKDEPLYLMSHIATKRNEYKVSIHEYIADFLDMDIDAPVTKTRIKSIVKTWLQEDVLVEKEVPLSKVEPKSYRHNAMVKIIQVGKTRPGN